MEALLKKDDAKNPADTPYLLKDLLQGNSGVALRSQFDALTKREIKEGLNILLSNKYLSEKSKQLMLAELWRVNYREKPPSIQEFLTGKWIGPMAESLHVHVKETLEDFWAFQSPYRHLVLGAAVGTGKSTCAAIHNLYVSTILFLMRNPKRFFGLAPSTSIVQAFISFSMDKAAQILLQPFIQILSTAPKFRRVKQEEHLKTQQEKYPDQICWTTASKMGALQFPGDIHYIVASGPAQLLGLNMIQSTMSEISFFIPFGFNTPPLGAVKTGGAGDLFPRIRNDCKVKSSIPRCSAAGIIYILFSNSIIFKFLCMFFTNIIINTAQMPISPSTKNTFFNIFTCIAAAGTSIIACNIIANGYNQNIFFLYTE
jgi:hypothetical protein